MVRMEDQRDERFGLVRCGSCKTVEYSVRTTYQEIREVARAPKRVPSAYSASVLTAMAHFQLRLIPTFNRDTAVLATSPQNALYLSRSQTKPHNIISLRAFRLFRMQNGRLSLGFRQVTGPGSQPSNESDKSA